MTSYKDYFYLLPPSELVVNSVKICKLLVRSIIEEYPGLNSTAHISLKQYTRQKPYLVESAIDQMEIKIKSMPSINLQTDNFNFFGHPNDLVTMYAGIKPTYQADNWIKQLRTHLNLQSEHFVPHITVAKSISVDRFYKVWPSFYNRKFENKFLVNRLLILERETLNSCKPWKIYREIKFNSDHVIN